MPHIQTADNPGYDRISLLSIAILLVLTWGFYRTYLVLFPSFEGFVFVHHFHGAIMLLWMGCLIIQPWLITRKKHRLHRAIGKMSFVLAPILMFSIFLVSKATFHTNLNAFPEREEAVAMISLSIPGLIIFGILYGLAVANKRRTFYHVRYMIGTGLLMIGPGLGRALIIYFQVPPPTGISITLAAVAIISAAFLVVDIVRKYDYRPNLIVVLLMVMYSACWELRHTPAWQEIGGTFATLFF